jgi:hypothetical protein
VDAISKTVSFAGLEPLADEPSLADPTDVLFKNFKYMRALLNQVPTSCGALYQGIIRLLLSRRISDPTQRKNAFKVIGDYAEGVVESLSWSKLCEFIRREAPTIFHAHRTVFPVLM